MISDFSDIVASISIDEKRLAQLEGENRKDLARDYAELRTHLVECGCPAKDLSRVLDGPDDMAETSSLRAAKISHGSDWKITVLSGARGIGKTTAAAWWLVQERGQVPYVPTSRSRFVDAALLARWDRYDKPEMRLLNRARSLVIDDLGIEYNDRKGAFGSLLDEVINARYAAELPTLITTNIPAEKFKKRYGERIADRIRESGRFVELSGESMRGKQ